MLSESLPEDEEQSVAEIFANVHVGFDHSLGPPTTVSYRSRLLDGNQR